MIDTFFILDDYRSLKVYGRRVAGIRSGEQDKGHLAELEAFHERITGRRPVFKDPEGLLSAARISLDVDNQILGVGPASG